MQVTNSEWNADKTSRNSFESYVLSGASRTFLEIIETGLLEEIQTSQAKWNQKRTIKFPVLLTGVFFSCSAEISNFFSTFTSIFWF